MKKILFLVIGSALFITAIFLNSSLNEVKNFSDFFSTDTLRIFLGIISGVFLCLACQKEKTAPYKRQLEILSVKNDSDSSKISTLEAKIKTLEKALDQALNK